jgi:hypothetical protein
VNFVVSLAIRDELVLRERMRMMSETNTLHRPDLRNIPECPVCHHNDQVKTAQEAYKGGVTRLVPPPLPKGTKAMMPWIVTGMAIYLCGNFYLLVQLGGGPGFSSWPVPFQVLGFCCV